MQYTLAKYVVRQEKLRDVKRAIAEFIQEVGAQEPRTLYLVFRDESKTTFSHLMAFPDDAAQRRHAQARHTCRFVKKLYPHCVGKPEFNELTLFAASRKQWPLEPR